jgi:hypothetical protein
VVGFLAVEDGADEAEVADLGFAVGSDENVGGFDISVDEIAGVEVVDG